VKDILIKRLDLSYILISILLLYLASASTLIENDVLTFFVILLIISLFFIKKNKVDLVIVIFVLFWWLINFMSTYLINTSQQFSISAFFSTTARYAMPYLIIKLAGPTFFDKFTRFVYVLSFVGLILF